MSEIAMGDIVYNINAPGHYGRVIRVSKNGKWADVRWGLNSLDLAPWSKRMRLALLRRVKP